MARATAAGLMTTDQEKTPGTVAAVSEGMTLKEGAEVFNLIIPQTLGTRQCAYAGYTIEVDPVDSPSRVRYAEAPNGRLARFTHRIFRIPSQRRFIVRHFQDSTPADRAHTMRALILTGEVFYKNRHISTRSRRSDGTWSYRLISGPWVEDPFAQLELEMMIDQTSGVTL